MQALFTVYVPRVGVVKALSQIRPTFKEHYAAVFWNRTDRVSVPFGNVYVELVIDVVEVDERPVQVMGVVDESTDMA